MAEYGQNLFNLLEVEPSPDDQVDEKPAGKEKKSVKKENKAPAKKAPASEAPVAAAPAPKAPRKRDYDRHVSGTGRGKETQKGGAGKHNWGDKDTTPETTAVDAAAEPVDAPAADDAAAEEDKQPTLGLDDYFKQLQAKRPEDDAKLAVREVVEDENFKAIRSLEKDEDADILFGDVMVRKESKKKGSASKKKASVSLDEFVKEHGGLQRERDFDRPRGGRGGARGGFRGGRGRGGFGGPAGPAPVGDDAAAAPAAAAPVAGDAPAAAAAAAPVAPVAAAPAAAPVASGSPAGGERGGFRGGRGRGGRGRGGDFERGRGRGGRGGDFRGDYRGGRGGRGGHPGAGPRREQNQASIDIANDELFPALGAAPRK